MSAPAETTLVCMPEQAACAILQSVQVNAADHPLLAGPMDLTRETGPAGRTSILFLAPGKKFRLGWGPDAEVRVNRWREDSEIPAKMLSPWVEKKSKVRVRLSNMGGSEKRIRVTERVPISEIEQVEIQFHEEETTGRRKPDANGMVDWDVGPGPYGRASCDLAFTLRKKKSVEGI